jgi:hypothetical protein
MSEVAFLDDWEFPEPLPTSGAEAAHYVGTSIILAHPVSPSPPPPTVPRTPRVLTRSDELRARREQERQERIDCPDGGCDSNQWVDTLLPLSPRPLRQKESRVKPSVEKAPSVYSGHLVLRESLMERRTLGFPAMIQSVGLRDVLPCSATSNTKAEEGGRGSSPKAVAVKGKTDGSVAASDAHWPRILPLPSCTCRCCLGDRWRARHARQLWDQKGYCDKDLEAVVLS